jgi:hypothetical protein
VLFSLTHILNYVVSVSCAADISEGFREEFCVEERRSITHNSLQILWVSMFASYGLIRMRIQPHYFMTYFICMVVVF